MRQWLEWIAVTLKNLPKNKNKKKIRHSQKTTTKRYMFNYNAIHAERLFLYDSFDMRFHKSITRSTKMLFVTSSNHTGVQEYRNRMNVNVMENSSMKYYEKRYIMTHYYYYCCCRCCCYCCYNFVFVVTVLFTILMRPLFHVSIISKWFFREKKKQNKMTASTIVSRMLSVAEFIHSTILRLNI